MCSAANLVQPAPTVVSGQPFFFFTCTTLTSLPDVQPMAAKVESGLKDSSWNCDTARSNQQPTACLVTSKVLGSVQESLVYKLQWASSELQGTTSVEYSTALCQLVKACAEALHSVGATCVAASVPDH